MRAIDGQRTTRRRSGTHLSRRGLAEVEALEPGDLLLAAGGDLVEVVLHRGREPVVDQIGEVVLEQADDGEGGEGGDERCPLFPDITTVLDRADDAGVGRGPADPELFQATHERGLGVARRRLGGVVLHLEALAGDILAGAEPGQAHVLVAAPVRSALVVFVLVLAVDGEEPGIGDDGARRDKGRRRPRRGDRRVASRRRLDARPGARPGRVVHLRGDGPLPDELVEPPLFAAELAPDLGGGAEAVAGGPDRLVSLLGVFHPAPVHPRGARDRMVSVKGAGLFPGGSDCGVRQRRRVGSHVGDVPALIQVLGDLHRPLGRKAQLAGGLLLKRRGDEGSSRRAPVRALLDAGDFELGTVQRRDQPGGRGLIEEDDLVRRGERPCGGEVLSGRDLAAADLDQARGKGLCLGGETALHAVPAGRAESHAFALAFHDDPRGDALHPTRRQALGDLAPQHRRDLVAVEAVEDTPGLLGIDQAPVELTRMLDRRSDGCRGDLVEDHAHHRDPGRENLGQVPCDRLPLAVLVCREVDLARGRDEAAQLCHLVPLLARHDVQGLEVVVYVDPESSPGLGLEGGGDVGC